jgi:hypothetical protein
MTTLAYRHLFRAFAPLREHHTRSSTVLGNKLDTCALKSRNQLFGRLSPAANCIGKAKNTFSVNGGAMPKSDLRVEYNFISLWR